MTLGAAAPLLLSAEELRQLTGYRQHARQVRWLNDRLKIRAPQRADGLPIVTRAQLEATLAGQEKAAAAGPRWRVAAP